MNKHLGSSFEDLMIRAMRDDPEVAYHYLNEHVDSAEEFPLVLAMITVEKAVGEEVLDNLVKRLWATPVNIVGERYE